MTVRRVLLATYHFPPSTAVGALRASRLARLLPDHGYVVDVICADEAGEDINEVRLRPEELSAGRVYRMPRLYRLNRDPTRPPPEVQPARMWWKARAYIDTLFLTKDWSWKWGSHALRALEREISGTGYHALIASAPPNPAIGPFVLWAHSRGIPTVVDLRDVWGTPSDEWSRLWPVWPDQRRVRWSLRLRDRVLGAADHLVVNTPEMTALMRKRLPHRADDDFTTIPNAFAGVDDPPVSPPDDLVVRLVHTGSLSYGRVDQAIAIARAVALVNQDSERRVLFIQAGSKADEVRRVVATEDLAEHVVVHDWITREQASSLQDQASALVLLQPSSFGPDVAVPAKIFEYMARRKPILGIADGAAGRVIEEHRLGETTSSLDPRQIADSIRRLLARIDREPLLPIPPDAYSEATTVAEFAGVLDQLTDDRRPTHSKSSTDR